MIQRISACRAAPDKNVRLVINDVNTMQATINNLLQYTPIAINDICSYFPFTVVTISMVKL